VEATGKVAIFSRAAGYTIPKVAKRPKPSPKDYSATS